MIGKSKRSGKTIGLAIGLTAMLTLVGTERIYAATITATFGVVESDVLIDILDFSVPIDEAIPVVGTNAFSIIGGTLTVSGDGVSDPDTILISGNGIDLLKGTVTSFVPTSPTPAFSSTLIEFDVDAVDQSLLDGAGFESIATGLVRINVLSFGPQISVNGTGSLTGEMAKAVPTPTASIMGGLALLGMGVGSMYRRRRLAA